MSLGPQMAKIRVDKEHPILAFKSTKNVPRIRKNEKLKNRASSCFKLDQNGPRSQISWKWDTDKIYVL